MKPILFYTAAFFTFLLISCEGPEKATSINHAYLYNKNIGRLHPQFNIYHLSETQSQVDFLLDAGELLYMKHGSDSTQRSQVFVQILLHSKFESTDLLDSASTKISDVSDGKNDKFIHGTIKFKATYPNTYNLEVIVADLNRKVNFRTYLFVDKSNRSNPQNFMLLSDEGREYFGNEIGKNDRVQILTNNDKITGYTVKYYNWRFHMPAPPFSMKYVAPAFNHTPDSIYHIGVPGGTGVSFPKHGLYLIQNDTSKTEGITLLRFYDGFPDVTNTEVLVNALRYVTSKDEFTKLHESKDKKAAVDKFWLDLAGSEDRAKELISKYYNRVQDANRYFTSYTEGWRTDRGMVYLIFGPPSTVYKTGSSESWVYGMKNNPSPITFIFVHETNRFTTNDFQLRRDPAHKAAWYRAVEAWRQGRMYSE
ncbi:MAG TPA: GWxTD domain-containing protein [Bacteroidia bacterium]|jgi:GWxTD domain-containing protein|nr:GWxTD domain-containing protein [Bacteroidia bacterium]